MIQFQQSCSFRPVTVLKIEYHSMHFPVYFMKIFNKAFFIEQLRTAGLGKVVVTVKVKKYAYWKFKDIAKIICSQSASDHCCSSKILKRDRSTKAFIPNS